MAHLKGPAHWRRSVLVRSWGTSLLLVLLGALALSFTMHNTAHTALPKHPDAQQPMRATNSHAAVEGISAAVNSTMQQGGGLTSVQPEPSVVGRWAYVFYITSTPYLCSALINVKRLKGPLKMTPEADIVVLHSAQVIGPNGQGGKDAKYIANQLQELGVIFKLVEPITQTGQEYFKESLTKLRVFELEEYTRIIYLDADGLLWKNVDHLFLLPPARIAMPRSNLEWDKKNGGKFASCFMVIQPHKEALQDMLHEAYRPDSPLQHKFDMDILDLLYGRSCIALPSLYSVLTLAFATPERTFYADYDNRPWDSRRVKDEAYYIHYSGMGVPKPWGASPQAVEEAAATIKDPVDREVWTGLYKAYWEEMAVCKPS